MNITLVITIGLLLLFIGWLQWRHERWVAQVVERVTPAPPVYFVPTPRPAPLPRPLMYADLFPEEAFELSRRVNDGWGTFQELAPTRQMRPSIHPRFESYGVDISVAPCIGIGAP